MASFLDAVAERVVIYDGAIGTGIQQRGLTADDFGGEALEGCNEMLVRHPARRHRRAARPLLRGRRRRHRDRHLRRSAGAARRVRPRRPGPRDQPRRAPASPARRPTSFATPDRPRFVAGSIGPGTKFPSLGQIRFADAARPVRGAGPRACSRAASTCFIIETQFDLLSVKAAMIGARRAMAAVGREVPLQVQVTIELTGRMLPGTEIAAALCRARRRCGPTSSASTAPPARSRWASTSATCPSTPACPISCIPNAGLPSVVDGHMHYDLTPRGARRAPPALHHRARRRRHRRLLRHHARAPRPPWSTPAATSSGRPATPCHEAGATSIYSLVPFHQDTSFLIIGERTNANGSKKFREAMLDGDWDTTVAMAKDQVKEGSHVLDVCVDYVGRDGTADMDEVASRFATQSQRAARARLDRAPGHGGRPAVARRPGHPQLGQPRGRRGRPARGSTACSRWPASTAPRSSACSSTRRARPATSSGSCASRTASTTSPSTATASSRAT